MQIVPLGFCHIGTKRSVLWPSKYAIIICILRRAKIHRNTYQQNDQLRKSNEQNKIQTTTPIVHFYTNALGNKLTTGKKK